MTNRCRKKPTEKAFRKAVRALGGNLTKVADCFGVSRGAVYQWLENDAGFRLAVKEERMKLYDEVLVTSRVVALGVPKYDYETDPLTGEFMLDEAGRPRKVMIGWAVAPDPNMLRYFLSKLGKREGFGDEPEDDEFTVKHGVNIRAWIQKENEG